MQIRYLLTQHNPAKNVCIRVSREKFFFLFFFTTNYGDTMYTAARVQLRALMSIRSS